MAHRPMLGPDSAKLIPSEATTASSAAEKSTRDSPSLQKTSAKVSGESEFAQVLVRIRAHAGEKISAKVSEDLALEVVLNGIVEQACLATGATGAAIALGRGGEMVCRATSGGKAPGLGMRLDTNAGLSGACVRSGQIQRCDDAWNDHRADPELLRQLNVRSVLVYPIFRNRELVGILEVFSPLPAAFGDRDLQRLEILAQRIVHNVEAHRNFVNVSKISASPPAVPPSEENEDHTNGEATAEDGSEQGKIAAPTAPGDGVLKGNEGESPELAANVGGTPGRRVDWFMVITATIIFAIALLMGAVVSVRMGWLNVGGRREVQRTAASPPTAQPQPVEKQMSANSVAAPAQQATQSITRQPALNKRSPPLEERGSLKVFARGKEISQMPPPARDGAGATTAMEGRPPNSAESGAVAALSPETAEGEIIQRVEPQYPPHALAQRVQGAVLLDVQVGRDGRVKKVEVLSGDPLLSDAAVAAVRQWRFKPHTLNGRAVETESKITLKFTLPSNQ